MLATVRDIILLLAVCAVFASPGYAYLDPGTGSIILQSILASIAVAMGLLRFYWQQFKAFVTNLMGSSASRQEQAGKDLDIDSEPQNRP